MNNFRNKRPFAFLERVFRDALMREIILNDENVNR